MYKALAQVWIADDHARHPYRPQLRGYRMINAFSVQGDDVDALCEAALDAHRKQTGDDPALGGVLVEVLFSADCADDCPCRSCTSRYVMDPQEYTYSDRRGEWWVISPLAWFDADNPPPFPPPAPVLQGW